MSAFGFGIGLDVRQRRGGGAALPPPVSAIVALVVQDATLLPDGGDAADPNGWVAKAVLPFDGAATFDPTRIVLTVADPGFNPDGSAATRTRTIRGGAIVRRQYPNQAERLAAQVSTNLEVYFSLEEEVFAGSTIVAVAAEAGYYGDAAAGSVAGIVNASTLAYPKPLAGWVTHQHERATGAHLSVEAEVLHSFARNGQQVACVEFVAKDAQASPNASALQRASAPALSIVQTQGQIAETWQADIPLANLTQGDLCHVGMVVKPWIGEAWDLEDEGAAWPTGCPQTLLRFVCDKTGGYGGAQAWVKAGYAGENGASIVGDRSRPFANWGLAFAALPAWNLANKGHNDHSGSTVFLMDDGAGGPVAHVIPSSYSSAGGLCWTEVRVDPLATGAVSLANVTANRALANLTRIVGVPITASFGLDGGTSTSDLSFAYEGLTVTETGTTTPFNYRNGICFMRNVTITGITAAGANPFKALSNTRMRLHAVGVVCTDATADLQCYPYLMIGCDLRRASLVEYNLATIPNAEVQDGMIVVNNKLLSARSASQLVVTQDYGRGIAMVQNVIERAVAADSQQCLSISEGNRPIANLIFMHNTIPGVDGGARFNWLYTDDAGAQNIVKRAAARFNLLYEYNCKSDSFTGVTTETGRVGNWRARYGVGGLGNVVVNGSSEGGNPGTPDPSGGNWLGEYWEPGSATKAGAGNVGFVSNLSGTAGAGGGDYALTGADNAAYDRVPAGMAALAFDLAGVARRGDGSGAAGAYERDG